MVQNRHGQGPNHAKRRARRPNRESWPWLWAVIALWLGAAPLLAQTDPLNQWTQRNPLPMGDEAAIAYGDGQFVAVGSAILTSPDGVTWTERNSGTTDDLFAVAYGNGQFVAVGGSGLGGSGTILTSPDGVAWTSHNPGTRGLNAVGYGGGQFVAVGGLGTILTSPDGAAWVGRWTGATDQFTGVTYGNSQFVVVGAGGTILQSGTLATATVAVRALLSGHTLQLSVGTRAGPTYVLQYKNSLADPTWTDLGSQPGDGSPAAFSDDTTAHPARFYRIRVE